MAKRKYSHIINEDLIRLIDESDIPDINHQSTSVLGSQYQEAEGETYYTDDSDDELPEFELESNNDDIYQTPCILKCPVCLEEKDNFHCFKECGHVLCTECIYEIIKNKEHNVLYCSVCRNHGAIMIPLVDKDNEDINELSCLVCSQNGNNVTYFCLIDCGHCICQSCLYKLKHVDHCFCEKCSRYTTYVKLYYESAYK